MKLSRIKLLALLPIGTIAFAQAQLQERLRSQLPSGSVEISNGIVSRASLFLFQDKARREGKIVPPTKFIGAQTFENYKNVFVDRAERSYVIVKNGAIEKRLLDASDIITSPHETGTVALYSLRGLAEVSPRNIRGENSELDMKTFNEEFARFGSEFSKRNPHGFSQIEIFHTHPFHELKSGNLASYFGLSEEDFDMTKRLSEANPITIIMRAILPNGYSYATAFYQGKNISLRFFKKN